MVVWGYVISNAQIEDKKTDNRSVQFTHPLQSRKVLILIISFRITINAPLGFICWYIMYLNVQNLGYVTSLESGELFECFMKISNNHLYKSLNSFSALKSNNHSILLFLLMPFVKRLPTIHFFKQFSVYFSYIFCKYIWNLWILQPCQTQLSSELLICFIQIEAYTKL